MPNKATTFTVVSAIGLCNLVAFLLFTTPMRQMAFSYLPMSNDTGQHRFSSLNLTEEVAGGGGGGGVGSGTLPFVERTLMQTTTDQQHKRIAERITRPLLFPLPPPPGSRSRDAALRIAKGQKGSMIKKKGLVSTVPPVPLSTVEPPPVPRVDAHNYSYVINQPELCGNGAGGADPPMLVVFVCTSIGNSEARQSIRDTWGSVAHNATALNGRAMRLVFLLGSTTDARSQSAVASEASRYSDIVQEDFLDTYNNLTLKSVMMLRWMERHCKGAQFLLKTDDDMFIHVVNLVKYLNVVKRRKRLLFGRLMRGARPFRQNNSKWFAPAFTYKERLYPDYLSGTAYAMSSDVARALLVVAVRTPLFHLEDVFVTGVCARRAGIPRRHHSGFTYERRPATGCAFRNAISGHKVSPAEMRKIWSEIHKTNACPR